MQATEKSGGLRRQACKNGTRRGELQGGGGGGRGRELAGQGSGGPRVNTQWQWYRAMARSSWSAFFLANPIPSPLRERR